MKLLEHVPLIKQLEIINRLHFFSDFTLAERQVLLESFSHLYLVQKDKHAFKRFDKDNRLFIKCAKQRANRVRCEHDELNL